MADQLITGTTLIEKESRSIGDVPIGGIVEWDDTFGNLPDGFVLCDGSTVNDPLSAWNGTAVQNLNTQYLSAPAYNWQSNDQDTDDISRNNSVKLFPRTICNMNMITLIKIKGRTAVLNFIFDRISLLFFKGLFFWVY